MDAVGGIPARCGVPIRHSGHAEKAGEIGGLEDTAALQCHVLIDERAMHLCGRGISDDDVVTAQLRVHGRLLL